MADAGSRGRRNPNSLAGSVRGPRDSCKLVFFPWAFPLWLWLFAVEMPFEDDSAPKGHWCPRAQIRAEPLCLVLPSSPHPLAVSFKLSVKYFHTQKGVKNNIN